MLPFTVNKDVYIDIGCGVRRLAAFGNVAEQCLENTITNIIHEAFAQEFNITARPRLVALPPRPPSDTD